ncbi:MAG: DUF2889 domain-containing protein [Candidatus Sedimenticola sp. (ex Thyasira tokunagai)]
MPLPKPVEREHLHSRRIQCEGFRRSDGLWDIEARMVDDKTYGFPNEDRGGRIDAGEAIHDMSLRITLDLDFVIHDVVAVTDFTPFTVCGEVAEGMRRLIGLRITAGWMREVRARVGRTLGCTHLVELLGPLATTAYQTMHWEQEKRDRSQEGRSKPKVINTCHAMADDGPIVERQWPEFYVSEKNKMAVHNKQGAGCRSELVREEHARSPDRE